MTRKTFLSRITGCVCAVVLAGMSFSGMAAEEPALKDVRITIVTTKGNISAVIYASQVPLTAANFLNLAKRGYYDGLSFHRVLQNFMIQGGDPTATGSGGPGYSFRDEIVPALKHTAPGILSMANAGPGTNGSQFFITHVATPWLDGKHSVFGRVTAGQEVVDKIAQGDEIKKIKFIDSPDPVLKAQAKQVAEWNKILDAAKK